jgi:NADH:ubiquinone oxidoreductase subunit 3 (subunit A)
MTFETLLMPPIAFLVILVTLLGLSRLFSLWAFRQGNKPKDEGEAYACGEDFDEHMIQPDYSQFFPFAFFFTILHMVALTITTVPAGSQGTFAMAVIYIIGAIVGLMVLLRD